MRDWSRINEVYDGLISTVYPQPEDSGHSGLAGEAIAWALPKLKGGVRSVVDFGCGTGFCQQIFAGHGVWDYLGVAIGEDVEKAVSLGRNVVEADFNFFSPGRTFDLGFARHALEHSPFPIITLSLWRELVNKWMVIILPSEEWYRYGGQNHFSVMPEEQAESVFEASGFKVYDKNIKYIWGSPIMDAPLKHTKYEYWYILEVAND